MIENMLYRHNSYILEPQNQHMLRMYQFGAPKTYQWFNDDGVAINLNHNHEIFVTSL
jgi:hypothetical protein